MNIKDSFGLLTSGLSAFAAITALLISLRVARAQRRIQEQQLKQDLFDKRYGVFLAVRVFLDYVFKNDGSVILYSSEFRHFRDVRQQAEFLFNADVTDYLKALNKAADDLYIKCR